MSPADEVECVVKAASSLDIQPRTERWTQLSLCVLDAVFSINANYATTKRTVRSYAEAFSIDTPLASSADVGAGHFDATEDPIGVLAARAGENGPASFASTLDNRQRTSTKNGILKAEAAGLYAAVLDEHHVHRLRDVPPLLTDRQRLVQVEAALRAVPGHGSGVRTSYLWMLAGDDHHVKPDRMVLGWLSDKACRTVSVQQAKSLITEAASRMTGTSPWMLDHAIWRAQRARAWA